MAMLAKKALHYLEFFQSVFLRDLSAFFFLVFLIPLSFYFSASLSVLMQSSIFLYIVILFVWLLIHFSNA